MGQNVLQELTTISENSCLRVDDSPSQRWKGSVAGRYACRVCLPAGARDGSITEAMLMRTTFCTCNIQTVKSRKNLSGLGIARAYSSREQFTT